MTLSGIYVFGPAKLGRLAYGAAVIGALLSLWLVTRTELWVWHAILRSNPQRLNESGLWYPVVWAGWSCVVCAPVLRLAVRRGVPRLKQGWRGLYE